MNPRGFWTMRRTTFTNYLPARHGLQPLMRKLQLGLN